MLSTAILSRARLFSNLFFIKQMKIENGFPMNGLTCRFVTVQLVVIFGITSCFPIRYTIKLVSNLTQNQEKERNADYNYTFK